jgi:hypothetical protein
VVLVSGWGVQGGEEGIVVEVEVVVVVDVVGRLPLVADGVCLGLGLGETDLQWLAGRRCHVVCLRCAVAVVIVVAAVPAAI